MSPEEVKVFLKDAHEIYFQSGRIIRRLRMASVKGLARFADAIEMMTDEELDLVALECERIALRRLEKLKCCSHDLENLKCICGADSAHESGWCGKCQPDESGEEREDNREI